MPNNEVEAPTLKPCPWCGKDAILETFAGAYRVRCSNLDCAVHPSYSCVDKHAAQRHWNTRTLPAVDVAELRERLAALCHDQWSEWMLYLFEHCFDCSHGTSSIVPSYAVRWQRQMRTPYSELSPAEKESDRKEADKFIALLSPHLCAISEAGELDKYTDEQLKELYDKYDEPLEQSAAPATGAGELISRAAVLEIAEPWLPSDIAAEIRSLPAAVACGCVEKLRQMQIEYDAEALDTEDYEHGASLGAAATALSDAISALEKVEIK